MISVREGFYHVVDDVDFYLKYSVMEYSHLSIDFIYIRNNKMKLKYILSALFDICREYNLKQIKGAFEKGFFIFGSERIHLIGYYVFLKYGFIPDKGVDFINKQFKLNKIDKKYTNIIEIYEDKDFFKIWKEIGVGFNGSFNLDDDSISMSIYKKIK